MQNYAKKILSVILVLPIILGMIPVIVSAASVTSYSRGDIIEFGWYPQTKETNSSVIASLNNSSGEWQSYGYYSGTGSSFDGKMTAKDYMKYKDVLYGGVKYRGVYFTEYRPYFTGYTSSSTYQDDNGYSTGVTYWFRYEPVKWRVLDPAAGLVMAETILDSQPFNNYVISSGTDEYGKTAYWGDSKKTFYANNYEKSSIRAWLNNDFYNTAFSSSQQKIINNTLLDNSAYSTSYSAYNSNSTNDKIYLLSYNDVLNTNYGFSSSVGNYDTNRRARGSDYAKCQGLYVYSSSSYYGNSYWRLRSPGHYSDYACNVDFDGNIDYCYYSDGTNYGISSRFKF